MIGRGKATKTDPVLREQSLSFSKGLGPKGTALAKGMTQLVENTPFSWVPWN